MSFDLDRRKFVGAGLLGGAALALPRFAFARATGRKRLVFVIQRGAADGLSTLGAPGDPQFAPARGVLAEDFAGAAQIGGLYAIHPALVQTAELFTEGEVLFAPAIASTYRDRSHFDAQNVLETGGTAPYALKDGWMNRLLGLLHGPEAHAIALAPTAPPVLRGPHPVSSYAPSGLPDARAALLERVGQLYVEDRQLGALETSEASLSQRARERGLRSLGTLGSGNHFLELQTVGSVVDEQTAKAWGLFEDQVVAMIHSGSRGLGHQVCTDHVRRLEASYKLQEGVWHNEQWGYELPDRQLAAAPVHSPEGQAYLDSMNAAANFAFANRAVLAERLRTVLRLEMGVDGEAKTLYDVAHNIAKMETHVIHGRSCSCCVHRKGATRAFGGDHADIGSQFATTGQPVIVPGDMGNGSWIMAGAQKGSNAAFGSSCHGAGRALSRSQAKKTQDGKALKRMLEERGVRVHASTPNVLSEEAPDAYKDVDEVIALTAKAGLARPVARMNPLAVIKG